MLTLVYPGLAEETKAQILNHAAQATQGSVRAQLCSPNHTEGAGQASQCHQQGKLETGMLLGHQMTTERSHNETHR